MQMAKTPAETLKEQMALPLIVAPMFLISTPTSALAACSSGAVGSFPALNQKTAKGFEDWLIEMNTGIADLKKNNPDKKIAPYAVNLIVHKTNPRLEEDLDLIVKHRVPIVITSLGAAAEVVAKVHSYGGIVLHDIINIEHAKKAIAAGVDGVIAVSAGAGGHAGTENPMTLMREIREIYDGVVVLAGGMSTGQDILAAEVLGADFAYMGTRFICVTESGADPAYKQMVIDAKASDIIYTSAVSGVPANFLKPSLEQAGFDTAKLKAEGATAAKLKPIMNEAAAWKTIWSAGQGAANITDIPTTAALVTRLSQERDTAAQKLAARAKPASPKI